MDTAKHYPMIPGVRAGLHQYYAIEETTDLFSLTSGKIMAKIGCNDRKEEPRKTDASFIVIDSKPHLTEAGLIYLSKWVPTLYLVTSNPNHPARTMTSIQNIEVIDYPHGIDFLDLFERLRIDYGAEKLTIQTGGMLNAEFLRAGLIDHVSMVIAPCLIGGRDTAGLIDGESLHTDAELSKIKPLKLVEVRQLEDSYLHLLYDVLN